MSSTTNKMQRLMALHGALVLFIGFIAGGMIAAVYTGSVAGSTQGWTLAHMEGVTNSLVLFAIAGVLPSVVSSITIQSWIAWPLIVMAYCNTVFGWMRAVAGAEGYVFNDSLANNVMTAAGMLGVPLGVIALGLLIRATWRAA